jgi:leader peptidase (prepilin peptidase)/N-methyltransferase
MGLAFGSFLNVCLSRWPEGGSVATPRSHCRQCGRTLAWWENVPLVSWLALRGRCRTCRAWIGWRYPLVEFSVGVLWAYSVWQSLPVLLNSEFSIFTHWYGLLIGLAGNLILIWLLLALAVLDAENLWLPNWLTLPGAMLGFIVIILRIKLNLDAVLSKFGALFSEQHILFQVAFRSLFGILAAAGLILLIRWVYWLIRRREGIGLGDAKLMALLAAWLGLPQALLSFGIGVVLGALAAIALLAVPSARRCSDSWAVSKLPLGTFLCIGGIVSSLWGSRLLDAYNRWAGF